MWHTKSPPDCVLADRNDSITCRGKIIYVYNNINNCKSKRSGVLDIIDKPLPLTPKEMARSPAEVR